MSAGMTRKTAPAPCRSRNTFARNLRQAGDFVGEVGVVPRFVLGAVDRRHDRRQQLHDDVGRQRAGAVVQAAHLAILAHHRRHRRTEVQVRGLHLEHAPEHRVDGRLANRRYRATRYRRRATGARSGAAAAVPCVSEARVSSDVSGAEVNMRRHTASAVPHELQRFRRYSGLIRVRGVRACSIPAHQLSIVV